MPELPEVETMRRGILGIVGSRIENVERVACRRRPIAISPRIDQFRRRAVGRIVRDVGRVGKRVVVHLDSDDAIVLEPRMTGLVLVADPPTREHLRFRCTFSGNGAGELLYWDRRGLGSVRLFSPKEFESAFGPDKLGPDALAMTDELFRRRLGDSMRAVKVAMLDQRAVAGIGNLYASEILAPGRHPPGAAVQPHDAAVSGRLLRRPRMRYSRRPSVTKAPRLATARIAMPSTRKADTRITTACTTKPANRVRAAATAGKSCGKYKPNAQPSTARDARKIALDRHAETLLAAAGQHVPPCPNSWRLNINLAESPAG